VFKNLKLIFKGLQRQIRVRKGIKEIQNLLKEKEYLLLKKYIIGLRAGDKFLDKIIVIYSIMILFIISLLKLYFGIE
jgi:hypothetical protein